MNLYNPTSNDLYGYTGGNKMNRRDKIAQLIGHSTLSSNTMIADKILSLIDSEPTGLVKVRNCLWHLNHGLQACVKGMDCPDCHGTGSIRTPMTQKEVVEATRLFLTGHATYQSVHPSGYYIKLPSGERVEVEG